MAEKNVGEQQESNELGRMGYAAIRPSAAASARSVST